MWHTSENGSNEKPILIDKESSRKYIIVRKQFEQVPTYDEEGHQIDFHWRYLEAFIPRESYDVFEQSETNKADVAYIAMMTGIEL